MPRKRPRIGDIIEIPLSHGRKAYAQYVFYDKRMGPLIQVFDLIADADIEIYQLRNAGPLFPPVITGLFAAVRQGMWKVVGRMRVDDFHYPGFVSTVYDAKTGKTGTWFLWDGERYHQLGAELPNEYQGLEFLVVWDPHDIVERIETGEYPEPYASLLRGPKVRR